MDATQSVEQLGRAYGDQDDPDVRERILLVLKVRGDGVRPSKASEELHRTKPWASKWLERFQDRGIDGLRTRRSGRPPSLSPQVVQSIRKELSESRQGWKTRQVYDLIVNRGGVRFHYTRVYQLLHEWELRLKMPRKRHVNTASREEKGDLNDLPRNFSAVSLDESFFTYDALVKRVWTKGGSRPVAIATGSHRHSYVFGTLSLDGRQLFRQYDVFNEDTFYEYLKMVHYRFPRFFVFLDKANPHYKSEKVLGYFERHSDTLISVWLPTASPDFIILEQCWNISKDDLLVLSYYPSFGDFRRRIAEYFRTKKFNLDMRAFLLTSNS